LAQRNRTKSATALIYIAAVVCFARGAFVAPASSRFPGAALGLVSLGLVRQTARHRDNGPDSRLTAAVPA